MDERDYLPKWYVELRKAYRELKEQEKKSKLVLKPRTGNSS